MFNEFCLGFVVINILRVAHILCWCTLPSTSVSADPFLVVHSLKAAGWPVRQSSRALFSKFIHLHGMKSPLSCYICVQERGRKTHSIWAQQLVLACKVLNGAVEERGRLMAHPHQTRHKKADGDRMDRCVFFAFGPIADHRQKQHFCDLVFLHIDEK